MDDPVQTNDFIKKIIDERIKDIIGIAITTGDRLTLTKGKSKYVYLFSLFLIMGPFHFLKNVVINLLHKLKKMGYKLKICSDPTLLGYSQKLGITAFKIKTPNSISFRNKIYELKPDIIIHQSQNIIKKELLQIPSIGVINRHNALLPKNRGRLTPFWVLYHREKETGVSIHFVKEGIDTGDIIVQEKIKIVHNETFNTLVNKNYQIALKAMIKALDLIESGSYVLIPNDDSKSTYNSVPTFMDALNYRINSLLKPKK